MTLENTDRPLRVNRLNAIVHGAGAGGCVATGVSESRFFGRKYPSCPPHVKGRARGTLLPAGALEATGWGYGPIMGRAGSTDAPLRAERSCPIPRTHNRLRQCHELWHRALVSYNDPDAFCIDLNNLISSLRTVTFVLQDEKRLIPGFADWYEGSGGWRARMRADARMRWLVSARNRIQKQGDLATYSTARVSLGYNWYDDSYIDLEVPPLLGAVEIGETLLSKLNLSQPVRDSGFLSVERRWVEDKLPEYELLDALAYCYGVLAAVVVDAHALLGLRMYAFSAELHQDGAPRQPQIAGRLRCMAAGHAKRTARLHLASGKVIGVSREPSALPPVSESELDEHYGEFVPVFTGEGDFLDFVAVLNEFARTVLQRDGSHITLMLLYDGRACVSVHMLDFPDRQHKMVTMQEMAVEVHRTGASAVVLISEAWFALAPEDPRRWEGFRPSEQPDRQEGLSVIGAIADGRCRSYVTVFHRTETGLVLEEAEVDDPAEFSAGILEPIRRVWRRVPRDDA